jgi:hypothetical protein
MKITGKELKRYHTKGEQARRQHQIGKPKNSLGVMVHICNPRY